MSMSQTPTEGESAPAGPLTTEQVQAIRQIIRQEMTRALRAFGEQAAWITEVEEVREYNLGVKLQFE